MMLIPVALAASWTGHRPSWRSAVFGLWSFRTLLALGFFMIYVATCGAYELVRTWRRVVRILTAPDV